MPFCSNCGSPVGEYDRFCSRCGNPLAPPPPNQQNLLSSRFPPKPSTNLGQGIIIGAGFALLIVGLLIAFSINGIYNQQVSYLAIEGIQVNPYAFLEGLVLWISGGVFLAVFGIYFLVLGLINQFSIAGRTAMNLKDSRARWGNGLITGGFVFTVLSVNNAIIQFYPSTLSEGYVAFVSVYIVLIVIGLVLILLGALLIRSAYLRSQRLHSLK